MKALAGMLLAFALAAGISNEAGAHPCKKTSARHHEKTATHAIKKTETGCVCKEEKSKLVLTRGLNERNSLPTNCVCSAGKIKSKQVASTGTMKTKQVASTGMIKTKSYGGYNRVDNTRVSPKKSLNPNSGDFDSTKFVPLEGGNLNRIKL